MGTSAELHLRWSSYESTLLMSVSDLWDAGAMTDVTLSAEGRSIKAHKVVLSACSGWFKEVLQDITPAQHPIIVLPFASYDDLSSVIQFMYKGEINITQMKLPGLLGCAESLRVKGLAKINPHRASGLLNEAIVSDCNQSSQQQHRSKMPKVIKRETSSMLCAKSSLSYGEDEEAIEITEISEECEDNLIMDEDSSVPGGSDGGHDSEGCDDSNLSGSEQSEGKLYFLTSLGQHGEIAEDEDEGANHSPPAKQKNRRRLYRAISAAWNSGHSGMKERSNNSQRSVIRKTLMPVSCPVCYKILSNAYNLKVHMSIHDGLSHQCSICGHTSKSRDALRKHLAYRHLIGMSGPVRPRMPSSKRKRTGGTDGDETDQPSHSGEMDEPHIPTAPTPTFSDPENDLGNSGGEDVAENHRPHQPIANTSSS